MCKENINSILGRVLVQTSPSQAYDTEATIEHAKLYDREFRERGIPRERFCIKIPATGPGVLAMRRLSQDGIPVLGTAVFNVEQAIACSQAGCIYISPYYNGKNRWERSYMMHRANLTYRSPSACRSIVVAECQRSRGRPSVLSPHIPDGRLIQAIVSSYRPRTTSAETRRVSVHHM